LAECFLRSTNLGVSPTDRNASLILLAVVVIDAAIWQAAGLMVARFHMLLENIDLEPTGTKSVSHSGFQRFD
jgi:hypothetical protein